MDTHKKLMYLASKLPLVWVETTEKHIMTKEELEDMGYVGAQDMGNGKYIYRAPVQIAKNHYSCLRNAYLRNGVKGCERYIDRIKKLKDA